MTPTSALLASSHQVCAWAWLAVVLLAPSTPGPAIAGSVSQDDRLAETVGQLPPGHAAAQRDKVLSAAARTAVNYVAAANQAIASGEPAQATRLLVQARRILDQIQGGLRERAAAGNGTVAVIPVMARVRLAQGGEVSEAVVARMQALSPQILAGDHDRVLAGLLGVGMGLTFEYVGMPVQATSDGIDRAGAALAAGESRPALEALTTIVQGLETRFVSIWTGPGQHD